MIRDIALVMKEEIEVGQIDEIIRREKCPIIESYKMFDVYKGEQVKAGHKSVAYRITFRAPERTLIEQEVADVMKTLVEKLSNKLGAEIRL